MQEVLKMGLVSRRTPLAYRSRKGPRGPKEELNEQKSDTSTAGDVTAEAAGGRAFTGRREGRSLRPTRLLEVPAAEYH